MNGTDGKHGNDGKDAERLREWAAQIRNGALYTDDPAAYRREIAQAEELERRAGVLEVTPVRGRMTEAMARAASAWRFNCGPGAICGVLDKTPDEIRPRLLDFETKGYTNPTLMVAILRGLGVNYTVSYRSDVCVAAPTHVFPDLGFMRVQWGGPWTRSGVPFSARYRQTHWVGVRRKNPSDSLVEIFDVNAVNDRADCDGWLPWQVWQDQLVPWLCGECVPQWNGLWWPTHVLALC